MKIYLIITPFFPEPDSFKGPYIYDQVKALLSTQKYDRIIVIKPTPYYVEKDDYVYEGIEVFRFKTYDLPSAIFPGIFDNLNIKSFFRLLKKLRINLSDVSVVHSHVTALALYANAVKKKNAQTKTILQHHGFDVLSLKNGRFAKYTWHRKYVRHYGAKLCNAIDLHVGVSKKTLDQVRAFHEIKMKDCYVLYNGVDTTKFYPIKNMKDNSIFKIGCIANFWKLKDQLTLIKAVEILINQGMTNIIVEFIGSGSLLQGCRSYVKENNLQANIFFEKEVFHSELLQYYNSLDLFVLPSYYEAFGCVYTEAYACGVPFICVLDQGITELIPNDDVNKWAIKKGDFKDLSNKIYEYKKNRDLQVLNSKWAIQGLIEDFTDYLKN